MKTIKTVAVLAALLLLGAAAIALASPGGDRGDKAERGHGWGKRADASLMNAGGQRVGQVEFRQLRGWRSDEVVVRARVWDQTPGFHGFHVHTVGTCTAPEFTSAGGHYNPTGTMHPNHAGDLPSLLVNANGEAKLVSVTDRFTIDQLRDTDGSAVIVHAGRDNYANIPTDRYEPDPDQTTLNTGDAGGRVACGQVR
jgi:superoxide dismutase, Cu-Zn family